MDSKRPTVNSKEALYMLDTDIEDDMKSYSKEITVLALKYINKQPKLYTIMKGLKDVPLHAATAAEGWAKENNNEFGELFQTELEMVNWEELVKKL